MDVAASERVSKLLDIATGTTGLLVDPASLRDLKRLAKASDSDLRQIHALLQEKLAKRHSQVRLLSVQVADELFMRSKLFRTLLSSSFDRFLRLTIGHRADSPLPPPADRAVKLRETAITVVEKWNEAYGVHYKVVQLGFRYLKDTLNFKFPNIREARLLAEQARREREERTRVAMAVKYQKLVRNFPRMVEEIQSNLTQMEECFRLIEAAIATRKEEEIGSFGAVNTRTEEQAEGMEGGGDCGAGARSGARGREGEEEEGEEAEENFGVVGLRQAAEGGEEAWHSRQGENAALHDSLKDLLKELVQRHIPHTSDWLATLSRAEGHDRAEGERILKEAIDLRNRGTEVQRKCGRFGIELVATAGDVAEAEDVEMEEVEWEDGEAGRNRMEGGEVGPVLVPQAMPGVTVQVAARSVPEKKGGETLSASKLRLLAEAPVVQWGGELETWGEEQAVYVNERGLDVENHWGPVCADAVISAERVREWGMRASYYEPKPAPVIPPCRAPLRDGRLCERRDLVSCPVHGRIVARDDAGRQLDTQKKEASVKVSKSPGTVPGKGGGLQVGMGMDGDGGRTGEGRKRGEGGGGRLADNWEGGSEVGMDLSQAAQLAVANVRKQQQGEAVSKKRARVAREHNAEVAVRTALGGSAQGLGLVLNEDLEGLPRRGGGGGVEGGDVGGDAENEIVGERSDHKICVEETREGGGGGEEGERRAASVLTSGQGSKFWSDRSVRIVRLD